MVRPVYGRPWLYLGAGAVWLGAAIAQPGAPAKPAQAIPSAVPKSVEGPTWASLKPAQRDVLAPLAKDWSSMDASRRAKWIEVADRYPQMRQAERSRVRERMVEWARMSPAERGRARLTFQESRQLTAQEKQSHWETYSTLSPEARAVLAEHGRKQSEPRSKPAATAQALDESQPKRNQVPNPPAAPVVKPVSPTTVQARPGATTMPMTKTPAPPLLQQAGQPKIVAAPEQLDRRTLLPRQALLSKPPAAPASAP